MAERKTKIADEKSAETHRVKMEIGKHLSDVFSSEDFEQLKQILILLQKFKAADSDEATIPVEFLCPLTGLVVEDPVTIVTPKRTSTRIYDRKSIEKYIAEGNTSWPASDEEIAQHLLVDNCFAKLVISKWCQEAGYLLLDGENLTLMLEKLSCSSSLSDKKSAAKQLRILSERPKTFKKLFGDNPKASSIVKQIADREGVDQELQFNLLNLLNNVWPDQDSKDLLRESTCRASLLAAVLKLSESTSNNEILIEDANKYFHKRSSPGGPKALGEARTDGVHKLALETLKSHIKIVEGVLGVLGMFADDDKAMADLQNMNARNVMSVVNGRQHIRDIVDGLFQGMARAKKLLV